MKVKSEKKTLINNNYIHIFRDDLLYIQLKKKQIKFYFLLIFYFIVISIFCVLFYLFILKNLNNNKELNNGLILSKKSINKNEINEQFIDNIKKIFNEDEILQNEKMSKYTTFKIGGIAKIFVKPKRISQIIEIIKLCNKFGINYFILGNGSNLLVSDAGFNGVIIQIHENNFSGLEVIKKDDNNYILNVGTGMLMKTLSIEACLLSLTGLEDIIDIPGTVGGGIIMNVSFKKSGLRDALKNVTVITPEGEIIKLTKKECIFRQRGSMLKDKKYVVIEATFELKKGDQMIIQKKMTNNTKSRYEKQPMYFGSAGCFFIWDHHKYGSMYEKYKELNLVSYRVGDAMIYTYNIAFIVNLGRGNSTQVMDIVTHIEKTMKDKYNIEMKREVIVIGSFNNIDYY